MPETESAPAAPSRADARRRPSSTFAIALGVIAVLALAVRIGFVVAVDPTVPRIGDANAYHLLAADLADGQGYIRPFDNLLLHVERPTAEYPPLFPVLLAVPAKLGADSVESQRIFLAFVGAATVVLVGLLGRRVGGRTVGIIGAALAAIYPMLFLSEGIAMSEALYAPLVVLALLASYRVIDAPTTANAVALGAALGLATLTRAEGALLAAGLAIGMCWRLRTFTPGRRFARAGVMVLVATGLVLPWTVRNAVRLDAFVPVSNNIATLVDGANCDATYSGDQLGLWRETFSQLGDAARTRPQAEACFEGFDIAAADFDEAAVAARHRRAGLGYARDHTGSLPRVTAARVLRTWGVYAPSQQVDFESLEGRPRRWQWAGTIMYWMLLPLAVAGVVLLVRRKVPIWPLVAAVCVVTFSAAATYGQQRFRVAAEPAILVAAAVPLAMATRKVRRRIERAD